MKCRQCDTTVNVRTDTWWDYDGHAFCQALCVYRYRGNQPGRKLV